jgi:hypothetical protein
MFGRDRLTVAYAEAPSAKSEGFDNLWHERSREFVAALRRRRAKVRVLPADSKAKVSRADLVTGPSLNYLLAAMVPPGSWVSRADRPMTLIWDDPLGALALWSVWTRDGKMGYSNEGDGAADDLLGRFRAIMSAPGVHHVGFDSGHIEAVESLGLAAPDSIDWFPLATPSAFIEQGRSGPVEPEVDVGFCGNLWERLLAESNFASDPFFEALTDRIVERKLTNLAASSWDVFASEIDALPAVDRESKGLVPSRTAFWEYYLFAVWFALTSRARTALLTGLGRTVDVFGLFADPGSRELMARSERLRFRGMRHYTRELPRAYAATKVNVCVTNGLIYRGIPSKLLECLASGGFALVDPKDDLVRLFGPDVETIFFRDAEELRSKVEYFLARPRERREIVEGLRSVIERESTFDALADLVVARRMRASQP